MDACLEIVNERGPNASENNKFQCWNLVEKSTIVWSYYAQSHHEVSYRMELLVDEARVRLEVESARSRRIRPVRTKRQASKPLSNVPLVPKKSEDGLSLDQV